MPWTPELVYADADQALGHCGPLFSVIWRQNTTREGARRLADSFRQWATAGQARHGLVTIIEADAPLPDPSAREDVAKFLQSISDEVVVSTVVFEGSGFKSAAVRGVVTGLTLLAKQAYPHRVFATVEEASEWFAKEAPADWHMSPSGFVKAVQGIRRLVP